MAIISVINWKPNFTGFTGWDKHAKSELNRRLRRGIEDSPAEMRQALREIRDRRLVTLSKVKPECVASITQILETLGGELDIDLESTRTEGLFRKLPRR